MHCESYPNSRNAQDWVCRRLLTRLCGNDCQGVLVLKSSILQAANAQSRLLSGVVTRYVEDIAIVRESSAEAHSDEGSVGCEHGVGGRGVVVLGRGAHSFIQGLHWSRVGDMT